MTPYVNVHFNKIYVRTSESYGPFGEPGNSAEWRVFLCITDHLYRPIRKHAWKKDEVRDNRTYTLDLDTVIALPTNGFGVEIYGHEADDIAGDDKLPVRQRWHTPEPGWHGGQQYQAWGKSTHPFEYTVDYSISYTEPTYSLLWNASRAQHEWLFNCSEQELRNKADALWNHGGRLQQMHAFVVGSDVRYNCVWNFSGSSQMWNPNCSQAHVEKTTGELWNWARPAQIQPFVVDNKVRYSCLWNAGTHSQVWNVNCSSAHLKKTTDELWSWARPAQLHAFVANGEVRYSCLWNAGTFGQVWNPDCDEAHFRKTTDELWSWARPAQVQPFLVADQLRYSCLWNAGTYGQVWNPNCNQAHVDKTTADLLSWARPKHVYAVLR